MYKNMFRGKERYKGFWIEGFLYYVNFDGVVVPCISEEGLTGNEYSEVRGGYEVIPETIEFCIGWEDSYKRSIFQNDIVAVKLKNGITNKYLIWYNSKTKCIDVMNVDGLCYDGKKCYGLKINLSAFGCLIQNVNKDVEEVQVIGNIIKNPEIAKKYLTATYFTK